MNLDELIEECQKLKAWRGGDGHTPVQADGFEIAYGEIDQGRAVLVIDSNKAMETAEKIKEEARERADCMISDVKEAADKALGEAMDALKDLDTDLDTDGEISREVSEILNELRHQLNRIDTIV